MSSNTVHVHHNDIVHTIYLYVLGECHIFLRLGRSMIFFFSLQTPCELVRVGLEEKNIPVPLTFVLMLVRVDARISMKKLKINRPFLDVKRATVRILLPPRIHKNRKLRVRSH